MTKGGKIHGFTGGVRETKQEYSEGWWGKKAAVIHRTRNLRKFRPG